MNVKNLTGLEAQEKKFSKLSMIFLTCQKSWNFLRRMISGCYGSIFHTRKARKAKNQFPCFPGYT